MLLKVTNSNSFWNIRQAVTFRGWDVWCGGCCHSMRRANRHSRSSGRCRRGKWRADLRALPSWFPHVDRCAATLKLSHNSGLNCSAITSYSLLRLKRRDSRIPVTSPLSHTSKHGRGWRMLNASKSSTCCQSEFSEMWQRQTLNGPKVHVLMASSSVIMDVFENGCLAGTNVYNNLSQRLWPSALLLNL